MRMHVDIYFAIIGVNFITSAVCSAMPSDPRDMFPASGVGDGSLRTLHVDEYLHFANRSVSFSLIPMFSTRSITECSLNCLQYFCVAFFYHFDRLDCTLVHDRLYNTGVTVEDLGSRYYLTFYDDCPSELGYVYYQTENLCLKLNTTKTVYWNTHYYCVLERATLVRIDSYKKLNMVQNLLDTQGYNNADDFAYIMSEPMPFSSNYRFVDGTEIPVYDWLPGKPDNGGERIVMGGNQQKYYDVDEQELHAFICERHIANGH